jgi:hypothetical protein
MSSPPVQYGFVLPEFCFVAIKATKHGALTQETQPVLIWFNAAAT